MALARGASPAPAVSRLWRREGEKRLVAFRGRSIVRDDWLVLMLDGIHLEKDVMAVVALGIADDGTKHLLDFELGASESTETAKGLLKRLSERGFAPAEGCRLLTVLDGSTALRTAVRTYWLDAAVQRCLVHKERNVRRFLRRGDWKPLARLFNRLRKAQGLVAGREALAALHRLGVPATLHLSLLSTNFIESPFANMRRKLERVSR